LTIVLMK